MSKFRAQGFKSGAAKDLGVVCSEPVASDSDNGNLMKLEF